MDTLVVAAGGALGAALRYAVGQLVPVTVGSRVPWTTLSINVIGSFALGVLMGVLPSAGGAERWRLFLGVGILGGFTTFSRFQLRGRGSH
ncbi:MAG: CrcB family protein [Coriobacteriia bacterium]|nr:CrcB family protein [Coriobacteriia bacterium]